MMAAMRLTGNNKAAKHQRLWRLWLAGSDCRYLVMIMAYQLTAKSPEKLALMAVGNRNRRMAWRRR